MSFLKDDGDQHEFLGHIVTGLMVAGGWQYIVKSLSCAIAYNTPHECFQQYSGYDAAIAIATSIFATLYLSPDLDTFRGCIHAKALHRWGPLSMIWACYLSLIPGTHHRGITHAPVVGAFVLGWPFMLIGWHFGYLWPVMVPIVIQQLVHIIYDWSKSGVKNKIRQFKERFGL